MIKSVIDDAFVFIEIMDKIGLFIFRIEKTISLKRYILKVVLIVLIIDKYDYV